jgi:N-hydroxyarylamine O-acetyltransferase
VRPETLAALQRAQVTSIPFENLDVMLRRGVSVSLPDIQDKLVHRMRGGYCYEHNLLFAAALQRLGFTVERVLARIGDPLVKPTPRSHLVLRVRIGEDAWLADAGFGSGSPEPLPLTDAGTHRQGRWTYRLRRGASGSWQLRELQGEDWQALYTVADESTYAVDIEGANHVTSTGPRSPFVRQVIVTRKDEQRIRRLIGREYSVTVPGVPVESRTVADSEVPDLLAALGLRLPPADVADLTATMP